MGIGLHGKCCWKEHAMSSGIRGNRSLKLVDAAMRFHSPNSDAEV